MEIALTVVGGLMIAATLLPLIRTDVWWVRIFDFPRLQITVVTFITLILYVYTTKAESGFALLFIIVLSLCLVRQAYMIYPYTTFARQQVQNSERERGDASCRLLFANVLLSNRDAERLRQIIREQNPDVILTVETDAW